MPTKLPGVRADDWRMRRARLIRDGMSWRKACLLSGYSQSVADRGPRGYMDGHDGHRRPGIMKDFERAAAEAVWKPEQLRKIVTHRLATAVIEGRPSNVAREAELLGKLKEVDLFNPIGGKFDPTSSNSIWNRSAIPMLLMATQIDPQGLGE